MSLGLAIHTSSPALGLAVATGLGDYRYQTWNLGRETSNYLHSYLLDFVQPHAWQDFAWIATSKGPGGFTGTRLGVVTARTLAQQLNLPLFGISSLAATVFTLPQTGTIAISLPTQRGELYGALYHRSSDDDRIRSILPDGIFSQAEWEAKLSQLNADYHHQIEPGANLSETVTGVIALADRSYQNNDRPHWSTCLPFYAQDPVQAPSIYTGGSDEA
jgi:tRNA threonylcarbamoyl adenosine modification protein YeaZ